MEVSGATRSSTMVTFMLLPSTSDAIALIVSKGVAGVGLGVGAGDEVVGLGAPCAGSPVGLMSASPAHAVRDKEHSTRASAVAKM